MTPERAPPRAFGGNVAISKSIVAPALASLVLVTLAACSAAPTPSGFNSSAKKATSGQAQEGTFGTNDGTDPTGGATPDLPACATASATAEAKPVYLVFMFDKSGSMDEDDKWTSCSAGLSGFFASAGTAGLSASLQFFPSDSGDSCGETTYAAPAVAMTKLPNATSFSARINAEYPGGAGYGGGTPTLPALNGAHRYAAQLAAGQAKDGKVVVVLVTDGEPNTCGSDIASVANAARVKATTVPTYVIGVGSSLGNLNAIASAGGTSAALLVNTANPAQIQSDLTKALAAIKTSALSCDYKIPAAPAGQTLDHDAVNVVFTASGAAPETLTYNQSCAGGTGWHYDNPTSPANILVCPGSCDVIKSKAGKVDVQLGCATKGGVPK